jgi:hypothetical protein
MKVEIKARLRWVKLYQKTGDDLPPLGKALGEQLAVNRLCAGSFFLGISIADS